MPSLMNWLAAFSTVQMRVRRTSSGAKLLLRRRRVNTSDGWEPVCTNALMRVEFSVDSQGNSCGDNGLVAMELGCDYGDLDSILNVT